MRIQILVVVLATTAFACKSKDEGTAGSAAGAGAAAAGEKPAAAGPTILAKAGGLKIDLPEGASVSDGFGGTDGVSIMGTDLLVNIAEASEIRPKTVAEARKEAEMYSPKNLKDETLADGWTLTYDNEAAGGKSYFVNARRTIGGKSWWCDSVGTKPEQQANALAACKNLRK